MKFPLLVRSGGASLAIVVSLLLSPVVRAQRPAPTKPAPVTTTATTAQPTAATAERSPSATIETLISADAYGIYAEMRAVGRHANSQEIAQLLAPLGFAGAPDELTELYEFLKAHADSLMASRLMFATMPVRAGLPEVLLAVEMPSVEEARKFVPELKQFIAANVAPVAPSDEPQMTTVRSTASSNTSGNRRRGRRRGGRTQTALENTRGDGVRPSAVPAVQVKRSGSIIAMSKELFTFKSLRGTNNQALLFDEPGFQAARTRFATDTIFVYFNTVRMSNSTRQRQEALQKEYRRQEELARADEGKRDDSVNAAGVIIEPSVGDSSVGNTNANVSATLSGNTNANSNIAATPPDDETPPVPPTPEATPSPKSEKELEEERQREQSQRFAQTVGSLVFGDGPTGNSSWPESIGIGASLADDALVLRGLFVNLADDQPLRPIPFLPVILSGPSIAAEAPAILPAETDIFVSASLDLPQMYDYLASMMKILDLAASASGEAGKEGGGGLANQLTNFEKTNNFRIKEELLAALGNEIAVGLPGQFLGMRSGRQRAADDAAPTPLSGPIIIISLNDKEGLQKLLPRVLASIGFAGASEQSIIEKRGNVEVLTFSNGTLAFIDRFLVGAPDAATMRRIADAYNNGETLANSERFRTSVSWQSRQALGQVYVSNAMLKGMFEDVTKSIDDIDDVLVRAYLMRLDPEPGSITHLATRESNGLMHEIHVPKNLLSLFTASAIVSEKLSTMRSNEANAQWRLRALQNAQTEYKASKGRYATLEELNAANEAQDAYAYQEGEGYEIKLSVSGDSFEATATPKGYPKLGRRSFYIDQTGTLRGGDTGGKPASSDSAPIID